MVKPVLHFQGKAKSKAEAERAFLALTPSDRLKKAWIKIHEEIVAFPDSLKQQPQNISIKISPLFLIELFSRFNPGKSLNEAGDVVVWTSAAGEGKVASYEVLPLDDLVGSKLLSGRPKDRLDIQRLQRKRNQL